MEELRIIGEYTGTKKGPLLICFGGVHGNELAGVKALQTVFDMLENEPSKNPNFEFTGKFVGIRGNLKALQTGQRFIVKDLNRQWTKENVNRIFSSEANALDAEDQELKALLTLVRSYIESYEPTRLVFMDLHTTSATGGIFTIATDDEESQRIAIELHAPVIKGMLNGIKGTTLHYFTKENMGIETVAVCFEAGQHEDPTSANNAIAAIINCMRTIGCVEPDIVENKHDEQLIKHSAHLPKVAQLIEKHALKSDDKFKMKPGYENFQVIKKGEILAKDKDGEIYAPDEGLILMPFYQKQGEDGYFIIKTIESF